MRLTTCTVTAMILAKLYWAPWFVEAGGLAAYSADHDDLVRRAVSYLDRILKGTKPADLPVEQPTTFQLVNPKLVRKAATREAAVMLGGVHHGAHENGHEGGVGDGVSCRDGQE
jgi:hypothetical protein